MTMQALPRTALEVIEAKFFFRETLVDRRVAKNLRTGCSKIYGRAVLWA
jgi:hypothetical protein